MEERISKEAKLNAVKEIVSSYIKTYGGEHHAPPSLDHVCDAFRQVYQTIDQAIPDPEKRKIGLGA